MAHDKRLAYLNDVVASIALLDTFCEGKTVADLKREALFRSAVERQLTIIGEAVTKILKLDPSLESEIQSSRQIVGFRNQLIHNYGSLDYDVVWTVISQELPILKNDATRLLGLYTR